MTNKWKIYFFSNPYDSEGNYASGPLSPQAQLQQQQQQYAFQKSQQPGQYQNQNQQPGQYQQLGEYQQSQYQQQQQPQNQQYPSQNQIDYVGQYSDNKNIYAPAISKPYNTQGQLQQNIRSQSSSQYSSPQGQLQQSSYSQPSQYSNPQGKLQQNTGSQSSQYSSQNSNDEDNGEYNKKYDEEETTGPPKGFFYSFDYPVGIIVKEEGIAREALKDVYDQNKAKYEAQLQSGHSDGRSQEGYLYVKNQ